MTLPISARWGEFWLTERMSSVEPTTRPSSTRHERRRPAGRHIALARAPPGGGLVERDALEEVDAGPARDRVDDQCGELRDRGTVRLDVERGDREGRRFRHGPIRLPDSRPVTTSASTRPRSSPIRRSGPDVARTANRTDHAADSLPASPCILAGLAVPHLRAEPRSPDGRFGPRLGPRRRSRYSGIRIIGGRSWSASSMTSSDSLSLARARQLHRRAELGEQPHLRRSSSRFMIAWRITNDIRDRPSSSWLRWTRRSRSTWPSPSIPTRSATSIRWPISTA